MTFATISRAERLPWRVHRLALTSALSASLLVAVPAVGGQAGAAPAYAAGSQGGTCVEQTVAGMSLAQQVGQLFMVGVDSPPTSAQLAVLDADHIGAVTFVHDSDDGVAATRRVTDDLRAGRDQSGVGLWIADDQEGGFVQHLRGPGFSDMPTALTQGTWTVRHQRRAARRWGSQLHAAGVDLDLAPVADTVPASLGVGNPPIGYYAREYAHRPSVVSSHAVAVRRGMRRAHVQTTAKHFPGLGRVRRNTDTQTGAVDRTTTRHGRYVLRPFRDLIGTRVPVVMISSARYTRIDADHLAAMSTVVKRGMLRRDMGFDGVEMSDSLTATGLRGIPMARRAVRFLRTGGDVALVGKSARADEMYRAVLRRAHRVPSFRDLVRRSARTVVAVKKRQGLVSCG